MSLVTAHPKRVLIVDDSATMRRLIRRRLTDDPRIIIVGEAANAFEARHMINQHAPDVITLDVEMPGMSGLEFLSKLMSLRPMPVVMISSETQEGSNAALEALSIGAIDCIGKPGVGQMIGAFSDLGDVLVNAASARIRSVRRPTPIRSVDHFRWNGKIVLIGSSTGGVDALEIFLSGYPADCPPTLIAQHMPKTFLASFARRLASRIAPQITLASDGMSLKQGMVCLAPGGETHLALDWRQSPRCSLIHAEKHNGYRPSVELLFQSAIAQADQIVAVMLTGMGRDGAAAMLKLRHHGAMCLAQDEATCAVFGMPRAAIENGAVEKGEPIERLSSLVIAGCALS